MTLELYSDRKEMSKYMRTAINAIGTYAPERQVAPRSTGLAQSMNTMQPSPLEMPAQLVQIPQYTDLSLVMKQ
jgi:hypothetical protein